MSRSPGSSPGPGLIKDIALVEGIIKIYTATLAIIHARIHSPKLLLSFVVLLSQLQLFLLCYFLCLSEQTQQARRVGGGQELH
jgi:hypothetical protein